MLLKCGVLLVFIVNVWCQKLFFYENSIGTLTPEFFENIQDKTKITSLDFRGTGIVRILDLAFQGFDNLKTLVLWQNYIECLPEDVFHSVQNVIQLQMSMNTLKYLPKNIFSRLRKLEDLHLNSNLLTKLEAGLFDNSILLKTINLENNRLTHIEDGIFSKLNNLKDLHLNLNYIHYIDRNSMPSAVPTNLENLYLWSNKLQNLVLYENLLNSLISVLADKNPWYCDCSMKSLYKKLKPTFQSHPWNPICDGPEHLKNRDWSTLQESDFVCDHNAVKFDIESNRFPRIGDNMVLACHTNQPVGDIAITYNNGSNVVEHLRRRRRFPGAQTDSTKEHSWYKLTIKEVEAQDAGYYKCVINGKVERGILLTINDPSYYEKCVANVYIPGK